MVNGVFVPPFPYRWATPPGRMRNSTATACNIYENHLCANCSHLCALPLQMLLNSINPPTPPSLATHVEAVTAHRSQCGPFTIYKSALLFTSGGCLGKNLIWVSDEQARLLSSSFGPGNEQWDHLPLELSASSSSSIISMENLWDVTDWQRGTKKKKKRVCRIQKKEML